MQFGTYCVGKILVMFVWKKALHGNQWLGLDIQELRLDIIPWVFLPSMEQKLWSQVKTTALLV